MNKQIRNKKKKKDKIPAGLRDLVWDTYCGCKYKISKCLCCNTTQITTKQYHCGHVLSEHDGGKATVDNLRPICVTCNSSMGTTNMVTYMTNCGIKQSRHWDGYIDDVIDIIPENNYEYVQLYQKILTCHPGFGAYFNKQYNSQIPLQLDNDKLVEYNDKLVKDTDKPVENIISESSIKISQDEQYAAILNAVMIEFISYHFIITNIDTDYVKIMDIHSDFMDWFRRSHPDLIMPSRSYLCKYFDTKFNKYRCGYTGIKHKWGVNDNELEDKESDITFDIHYIHIPVDKSKRKKSQALDA
ncbi:MAG: hypothetical protein Faunusvirus45_2 [Faunusvirus sp.]|jgi:hypothetical protein|uniref:HNH domain-containing protein n=1 Tax=Faunusvirus sp. TaxID=2487766 RepID=A0A3G4ZXV4_9VIRU|nr:MAG: hypothetical protein Faunusvirus45_2 [Faunusvirus sp.]